MPVETPGAPPAADPSPPRADAPPRRSRRLRHVASHLVLLLVGLLFGAAILATFQASGALPPPAVGDAVADADADVIVSVRQTYLNRVVTERAAEAGNAGPLQDMRIDLEPGRRVILGGDVAVLNQTFRATANGTIGVADGRVRVAFDQIRVGTLNLPVGLGEMVAAPINEELERLSAGEDFRIVDVATTSDRVSVRLAAVAR